ncbi:MAG: ExbD/TolR family protein [Lysobacteraceae bacterium]
MAFSADEGGDGGFNEPNVVPLVDVMLVLLIIFMVTAPLMNHQVQVELPKAFLLERPDPASQIITLSVQANGDLYWNDQPITRDLLETQLAVEAQKTPQPQIDIRADDTTRYQVIDEVVRTARTVGMRTVNFIATVDR